MKVLKALVAIKDGDGSVFAADVISHDGKNWIVQKWHECPAEYKKPERIVCLDNLRHQKTRSGKTDFVVNDPIPKAVLYDPAPVVGAFGYLVVWKPDIRIRTPRGIH